MDLRNKPAVFFDPETGQDYNPQVPDWLQKDFTENQKKYQERQTERFIKSFEDRFFTQNEKVLARSKVTSERCEALINLGRLDEAIALGCPDAEKIKHAVYKDDDVWCDDTDEELEPGVFIPRHYEVRKIFSPKHKKIMSLMKCTKCGDLNVTANRTEASLLLERAKQSKKPVEDREIYA